MSSPSPFSFSSSSCAPAPRRPTPAHQARPSDHNTPMATPHHKSPEADAELERKLQENAKLTQESQQRLSDAMKNRSRDGRRRRRRRRGSDASWNEDEYQETKKRREDAWTAMLQDMEAKAMRDEERERRGEKVTDIVDLEMLEVVEDYGHLSSLPESDLRDNDWDGTKEEDWDEDNSEGDTLGQDDDNDDGASSDSVDQLSVQPVHASKKKKASQRQPILPSESGSDYDYNSGSGSDSPAADDSSPKADNPEQQPLKASINTESKANAPTTTSRRRPWTAQDTALLMELTDQGVPYAALAARFGRTYMTIAARIKYVKDRPAERQSYQLWTSEDNALLLSLRAEKLSYKEIAQRLGRTEAQAASQHKRLTAKESTHRHA